MKIETLIKEIRSLVAVNAHTEAMLLAAKKLGAEEIAKRFRRIKARQEALGHLPIELDHARYRAYKEMMELARKAMPHHQYQQFHAAF